MYSKVILDASKKVAQVKPCIELKNWPISFGHLLDSYKLNHYTDYTIKFLSQHSMIIVSIFKKQK